MKYRRFELFIAAVLTVICYLGDYYLKEQSIKGVVNHTFAWHILNIAWLFAMVLLGYWGLRDHEIKWVKTVWIAVNCVLLILLLINKLFQYFWHYTFIPEATSTVIRTPFFFLMAAFLPRWFVAYKPSRDR